MAVLKFNLEHGIGQRFHNRTFQLNCIFSLHNTSLSISRAYSDNIYYTVHHEKASPTNYAHSESLGINKKRSFPHLHPMGQTRVQPS